MKIHKPTIESLVKEAKNQAYVIATVERSNHYVEHLEAFKAMNLKEIPETTEDY